jgi:diaminopimelate epimerase
LKFAKAHSLGNDFLYVAEGDLPPGPEPGGLSRAICHRTRGLGADGLVVYRAEGPSRAAMRIYNRDGSEAEMSGNGLRGLGAWLLFSGQASPGEISVETAAGARSLWLVESAGPRFVFRAGMGRPSVEDADARLDLDGRELSAVVSSLGNPHCSLLVEKLDLAELQRLGPRIENHPRFPARTNVELVEVASRSEIRVGFWERGVGETGSSGTGASAAAVAAIVRGLVDERVRVRCPGGELEVEWPERGELLLTGEAVILGRGEYLGGFE